MIVYINKAAHINLISVQFQVYFHNKILNKYNGVKFLSCSDFY